ncbi:hypothetical protein Tco_0052668 [Tanacetum coccineum]
MSNTSLDNSSSDSDNNSSNSASTSQISISKEIVYSSQECKGPSKSWLKWYDYLSDEYKDNYRFWGSKSGGNKSDAEPSFSDISKAKAYILAKASESSSKANVQASRSKAKVKASMAQTSPKTLIVKSHVPITYCVIGLANAKTWDAILSKTFGVKIPSTIICAKEKKEKRKIEEIIIFSLDSSNYSKGVPKEGPSVVSALEEGTSIQRLLYWYGYNIVEEYLSDTYFPTTDNDTTDKDNTDEDTIHESYSPKS